MNNNVYKHINTKLIIKIHVNKKFSKKDSCLFYLLFNNDTPKMYQKSTIVPCLPSLSHNYVRFFNLFINYTCANNDILIISKIEFEVRICIKTKLKHQSSCECLLSIVLLSCVLYKNHNRIHNKISVD